MISKPQYSRNERTLQEDRSEEARLPDMEMQESELRVEPQARVDMNGQYGEGQDAESNERTREEAKGKRRNFIIGVVFAIVFVILIIVFAIVVIEANKPGGVSV